MIDQEKFEEVIKRVNEGDQEHYTGSELHFLEVGVRQQAIRSNKVYNYINKGYIEATKLDGRKVISKVEVVKYLRRSYGVKSASQIAEKFGDLFS